MKYKVLYKEIDMAGKIRCWIDIGNDEVQIIKFQKDPTELEIETEVNKLLTIKEINKQSKLEAINQQISLLEERKKQLETK